ncbi:DUF6171 family protein [Halolactibacillus alkaliphilus]|uniref:DUF6171 family protein n=1 Tax=Halolactibacillus alkaliphilus TaxID=442899 RepID=UPI000B7FF278|nr:DUF6171 family protein [Halolactibacillus alkaliphilus]
MACKSCSETVRRTTLEVEALVKDQLLFETEIVSDSDYEDRITHCLKCDQLDYETTCRLCGCFVQFRAKLKMKACPHKNKKWDMVIN